MGTAEVNGKKCQRKVKGGTYKLEIPDGPTYYASICKGASISYNAYMYKRFVMGKANSPNRYIKTVMADDLNIDLKDNDGGFNCGKPAGYIEDFKALPEKTQDLIKQIKRVRVVIGTVEMVIQRRKGCSPVELDATPFIWEIDNRDAFKDCWWCVCEAGKDERLPVQQHNLLLNTEERKIPNGNSFYYACCIIKHP